MELDGRIVVEMTWGMLEMNKMTREQGEQVFSRRKAIGAPLALAGMLAVGGAAPARAQSATPEAAAGAGTTINVTGSGETSVAVDGGILQLTMRRAGDAGGGQMVNGNVRTADGSGQSAPLSAGEIAPVRQALLDAGIDKKAMRVVLPPGSPFFGVFGPDVAVINVKLDAEQLKGVVALIEPALSAGADGGLSFDSANMAYLIGDCADVEQAAVANAVTDGTAQAASLAAALGVTLGSLIEISKLPAYSSHGAGYGGGGSLCAQPATLESAATTFLGSFDPNLGGKVDIYAQVQMVFSVS